MHNTSKEKQVLKVTGQRLCNRKNDWLTKIELEGMKRRVISAAVTVEDDDHEKDEIVTRVHSRIFCDTYQRGHLSSIRQVSNYGGSSAQILSPLSSLTSFADGDPIYLAATPPTVVFGDNISNTSTTIDNTSSC
ncbi:Hypothetical predicted protein [Octopus vulgaris]|uniref:Uncharacterized protein n=1 Tax=Octopus vulgaris TaxID=6645 RepID=A0AA36FGG0_OCTVU|nr:Hypothetical predicted protein [Octopus vulgaris]